MNGDQLEIIKYECEACDWVEVLAEFRMDLATGACPKCGKTVLWSFQSPEGDVAEPLQGTPVVAPAVAEDASKDETTVLRMVMKLKGEEEPGVSDASDETVPDKGETTRLPVSQSVASPGKGDGSPATASAQGGALKLKAGATAQSGGAQAPPAAAPVALHSATEPPHVPKTTEGAPTSVAGSLLAFVGVALLVVGLFVPAAVLSLGDAPAPFDQFRGDSVLVLGMVGVSLVLVLARQHAGLWFTGLGALGAVTGAAARLSGGFVKEKAGELLDGKVRDAPAQLSSAVGTGIDLARQTLSGEWGWLLLVGGSCLLVLAAIVRKKPEEGVKPGRVLAILAALLCVGVLALELTVLVTGDESLLPGHVVHQPPVATESVEGLPVIEIPLDGSTPALSPPEESSETGF